LDLFITKVQDVEDIQINAALKVILKEFHEYFQQWQCYWAECMAAQGHYDDCGPT
jgi:hypothetical protein